MAKILTFTMVTGRKKTVLKAAIKESKEKASYRLRNRVRAINDPDALYALAWAGEGRGDFSHAERGYRRVLALEPCFFEALVNLGRIVHLREGFVEARALYRRAFRADSSSPIPCYNLGVLSEDEHKPLRMILRYYRAALRRDCDFADAHFNLSLLYQQLMMDKEACHHMSEYTRLVDET